MPLSRVRPSIALCAPALAAALLAGCSGEISVGKPDTLTGADVAKDLRDEYATRERASGITLTSLICEEVEGEVGATFTCSGRNSKEIDLELEGEITTAETDGVKYRWRIAKAFAPAALFEQPLRPQVERVLRRPIRDVSCPVRVLIKTDERFQCTVDLSGQARFLVDVRQTNGSGGFTWGIRRGSGAAGRSS